MDLYIVKFGNGYPDLLFMLSLNGSVIKELKILYTQT